MIAQGKLLNDSFFVEAPQPMKTSSLTWRLPTRLSIFAVTAILVVICLSGSVLAQQRLNKRYPAGKNVRIELRNISGTIIVESWNKDEIRLSATIESPNAHVIPKQIDSRT